LPADAAVWRNGALWTQQEHILAALAEQVDHWGRQHAVLLGMKTQDLPGPLQIERPKTRDEED